MGNNPGRPRHHSVEANGLLSGGVGKLRGFKKRFLALSLTRLNKTKHSLYAQQTIHT